MKKYTVVGFYNTDKEGYIMGEFNTIEQAKTEIEDEFKLDSEVDIDYYIIMKSEETSNYKNYWI